LEVFTAESTTSKRAARTVKQLTIEPLSITYKRSTK